MAINLSNELIAPKLQQAYIPDQACFNWCLEQQVVHSNNIELYAVGFVALAYTFIVLYGIETDFFQKYRSGFIYFAKLMLIAFFVVYILVIRLRIYY